MSAEALFAFFGEPTLWDLQQRSLAERGLEDGMAGCDARSHQRAYTAAFEQGVLFRCAQERRIALAMGNACRCPGCGTVYHDVVGGLCGCSPDGTPMEPGIAAMYGPGDLDMESPFYGRDDLQRLARDGVQIQTTDGERLNEQILLQ